MANQNPDNNFTQIINSSNAFDIINTESHLNTSGSVAESMTTNSGVSLATQLASPPKTQLYPIDEEMTKLKQRISNLSRQINIACQVCEQVDTKKDKTGKIIVDHGRRFNSKTKESKNEERDGCGYSQQPIPGNAQSNRKARDEGEGNTKSQGKRGQRRNRRT